MDLLNNSCQRFGPVTYDPLSRFYMTSQEAAERSNLSDSPYSLYGDKTTQGIGSMHDIIAYKTGYHLGINPYTNTESK